MSSLVFHAEQAAAAEARVNGCGSDDTRSYLEAELSQPVRDSIRALLRHHPRDPIRFLAHSLQEGHSRHQKTLFTTEATTATAAVDVFHSVTAHTSSPAHSAQHPSRSTTTTPPVSLVLHDGNTCEVRPVSADFARSDALHSSCLPAPSSFPSVLYREAASLHEVGLCLRQLRQLAPNAAVLLFVEAPAPTSTVFFYQGVAYACSLRYPTTAIRAQGDVTDEVQAALSTYGGAVQDFEAALRTTAADADPAVRVELLPSVQTNYLAAFDQITRALSDANAEGSLQHGSTTPPASSSSPPPSPSLSPLPSVLLVSYRANTARHTHARLLAAYGPYYEAAQRLALQALRQDQLERKKKFTFTFAMQYWTEVQRRREAANASTGNATAATASADLDLEVNETGSERANATKAAGECGGEKTHADAVPSSTAAKFLAKAKRVATRAAKRGLPTYDANQQAEDDVFLVVVRRLEHAAATLIQCVFRGHRARVRCQRERQLRQQETSSSADGYVALDEQQKKKAAQQRALSFGLDVVPPLLQASLERLSEEGASFRHIWTDLPTSPPPDSRRCWIYRPVQRTTKASNGDGAVPGHGKDEAKSSITRVREDWVQEELLIPPLRATEPRAHINLAQRFADYLAVAQCTVLPSTMQLFADSPGMSVLQRRAYDSVKSLCLTLFFVAYSELRQRGCASVPATFSQYMRELHSPVLTWFNVPHGSSLLLQSTREWSMAKERAAERAAAEVVRLQLSTHEAFLVAQSESKASTAAPGGGESGDGGEASEKAFTRLSSHVFLSLQPLLPASQWSRHVAELAGGFATSRGGTTTAPQHSADERSGIVHWWSGAAVPLCCVKNTPVAAVARWDAQLLDAAPAYDWFVPRVRSVAADAFTGGIADASKSCASRGAVAQCEAASSATTVIREWLRGDFAMAADEALAKYTRELLSEYSYLECNHVSRYRCGVQRSSSAATFIDVPHDAALVKYVAVSAANEAMKPVEAPLENSTRDGEDTLSTVTDSAVAPSCPIESHDRRERVMEAVVIKAAATRHNNPRQSPISASPRASVSGFGWSHSTSAQPSVSEAASVSSKDSQDEPAVMDKSTTLRHEDNESAVQSHHNTKEEKTSWSVQTVDEVASEVATTVTAATLRHTRRALRFVPGLEGARQLDDFVDLVVAAVATGNVGAPTCLVFALDITNEAFFALAAALVDHRLHGNRSVHSTSESASLSAGSDDTNVESDEHLRFLGGYHAILNDTLSDTSTADSTPKATPEKRPNTSVQLAVAHVSCLLNATTNTTADSAAAPSLHLLKRLKHALQRAEGAAVATSASSAADVQYYTTQATQLAEQYAWLVLLEWYLWSPHFPFTTANEFSPARRRSSARSPKSHGFAEVMQTATAALQWMEEMDPWAAAGIAAERCPDPFHRRYSNGLRRWDDRHYLCFGVYTDSG